METKSEVDFSSPNWEITPDDGRMSEKPEGAQQTCALRPNKINDINNPFVIETANTTFPQF